MMVINLMYNQMRKKLIIPMVMLSMIIMGACKKETEVAAGSGTAVITAKDFTFNTALKVITPDEEINGEITAAVKIKQIYGYLVRTGKTDSLVYRSTQDAINQNNFQFNIPTAAYENANLEQLEGIKLMVKHQDNSTSTGFVKVTSFTPPLPSLIDLPVSLLPDANGKILITGTATSENGLKSIEFYDDYQGIDALVEKIELPGMQKSYSVNYSYTYRENAANLKVVVTDQFGLKATKTILIPLLKYNRYQDIEMMANGTTSIPSASSFFIGEAGNAIGNCDANGKETKIDFVTYCTSTAVFTFYSPQNTTSISKNFKCGAGIWEPNTALLKASKFRVLLPGTNAMNRVYDAYVNNTITELNDDFFTGITVPGGSTAKYDALEANQASSVFNTTTAYLIWVRVPHADGVTFTNQLIRVKEVNIASTVALSTIKFDVLVSK
jgi:hypothetical protein